MPLPQPENHYSTDITNGQGFDKKNWEQFTVYFRVLPKQQLLKGKRRERQIQLEKISARLTTAMRDLGYTIAESRALEKYQFAHAPAQVVMVGFASVEDANYRSNEHPVSDRTVNSNGTRLGNGLRTGKGGNVQHGQNVTDQLTTAVSEFKTDVDTMLSTDFIAEGVDVTMIKLDYLGVTYGAGGLTFPV